MLVLLIISISDDTTLMLLQIHVVEFTCSKVTYQAGAVFCRAITC